MPVQIWPGYKSTVGLYSLNFAFTRLDASHLRESVFKRQLCPDPQLLGTLTIRKMYKALSHNDVIFCPPGIFPG